MPDWYYTCLIDVSVVIPKETHATRFKPQVVGGLSELELVVSG